MNYYSFEHPLLILLLIPIILCLIRCKEFKMQKYFVHLQFLSAKKSFFKLEWILKVIVFVLLCIALSSPIVVDKSNPLNRFGKDIVLAIDASGSMNASGFDADNELSKGERLSRFLLTKLIAKEFILSRSSDNVGVVLYGDFAFIASPITYEKEIVADMLEYLTQGMAGQNTAIGEAIAMGVRSFEFSKAKSRVMILLSDGEHNGGRISPKDATALAKSANIKIYTIGIGEADSALMREIAKETGGVYYNAPSAKDLQSVYNEIDKLESSKISSKEYKEKDYYFQALLLFASFFLLILLYRELKK